MFLQQLSVCSQTSDQAMAHAPCTGAQHGGSRLIGRPKAAAQLPAQHRVCLRLLLGTLQHARRRVIILVSGFGAKAPGLLGSNAPRTPAVGDIAKLGIIPELDGEQRCCCAGSVCAAAGVGGAACFGPLPGPVEGWHVWLLAALELGLKGGTPLA